MAFNAKNLQYDKKEPSFLRKLKGEFSGLDGRHNVQIPRPKKDRLKTGDDDEDEPVIIDEQGERIEKAEFDRRMNAEDEAENGGAQPDAMVGGGEELDEGRKQAEAERQKVAEIGSLAGSKKRKVGKIVGGEDESEDAEGGKTIQPKRVCEHTADKPVAAKKDSTVQKKKGKKIKLSFDDPDG